MRQVDRRRRQEFGALRCKNCESENREGRKFCASCGSPLNAPCPDCGYSNERNEKYCGGCGRRLATDPVAPDESAPPDGTAGPQADRRPVVVLFCDLVGYSRLSSQLDPEEVHALLERFFATVDGLVDRFGGTIDKHIGDAAMALFGAPLAHGDDAERAVRAALEIHKQVASLPSAASTPLAVHIGIAAGEVVASTVGGRRHRDYTVTGEAANIAARLLAEAASGETFVSDAVRQATMHMAAYEPLGPLALRGVGHAVVSWRLTGLRIAAPEATALVGRRSELNYFRATLEACVNEGAGVAVLIRGEAGIGKTRLVEEIHTIAAASTMDRHAGLVLDFGTARGRGAVPTIVAALLDIAPGASTEAAEGAIEAARRQAGLQADDMLYLHDLVEMPQPDAARGLYEAMDAAARTHGKERALTAVVKAAAERRPLLITIEDIHWADAETLNLLAAIARASAESRTVLVMTARPEGDPIDAHWRARAGPGSLATLDLSPLSSAEARTIAERLIDADVFVAQCVERAGGNPLFLEQLLRGAGELTDGRLPASIQGVVLARTDLLPPQDRRAIQAASVLGQRFNLPQLRALLREPEYRCDTLVRNVLARPTAEGFQFVHALVRDGVYASLTHARRRELHKAAAGIFIGDPVLRAEHLDRADHAEAPRAYFIASEAQARLFRHDHAVALATRGLALATEKRDALDLALLLGDLQQDAGRGAEALEAYRLALEASGAEADRCRALLGCAAANRLTARIDDAFSALAEAEPLANARQDSRALAEIHYLRGNLHFARGALTACRSEHALSLEAASTLNSPEWQARALSGLADAQYMDCRMATALRHFSDCIDLCDAHELTRIAVPNRVMMGHCRIYACDFDTALEDMRKALETAVRIGNRRAEMFANQSIGLCLTAAGRYPEAANLQAKALDLARVLKARRYEAVILAQCAEVALSEGRKSEALALARTGRDISEETGPGFAGPMLYGLLGLIEESPETQETAHAAGEALLWKGSVGHNHFWFRRYAIERALLLGQWDEVVRHADALLLRMSDEPLDYASLVAQRGKCLALRGRGASDEANEAALAKVLASAAKVDMRVGALGEALLRAA
jgi:class 3 adenylate cyclase/tetratricopeptide (TPR) repeat protein